MEEGSAFNRKGHLGFLLFVLLENYLKFSCFGVQRGDNLMNEWMDGRLFCNEGAEKFVLNCILV